MSVRKRAKGDGQWFTDVVIRVNGVKVREREACGPEVRTRAQALAVESERRSAMLAARAAPPPSKARLTFAEHVEDVMRLHAAVNNKHSERTSKRRIFDLHLVPAFGPMALEDIGDLEVAAFKASKLKPSAGEPLTAKTVNNLLTVLRKSLALAVDWKRLRALPSIKFLRTAKPTIAFFTFEEAPRLLEGADPGPWRAMILCGLRAGLRQSELLELRWEDVDLARMVVHVRRAIYDGVIDTPKGGRSRDVPMSDELVTALRTLPSRFAGGLLWPGEGGRNLKRGEAKWPLYRACMRAGLRRVGWHVLRHTFASHLVMRGVPLKAVQELLGHEDIATTMRYAHLSPQAMLEAVNVVGNVVGRRPMVAANNGAPQVAATA